jgi:hypothetical protein
MQPTYWLISGGDTGVLTKALVIEASGPGANETVEAARLRFAAETSTPLDQVVVNPVGPMVAAPFDTPSH